MTNTSPAQKVFQLIKEQKWDESLGLIDEQIAATGKAGTAETKALWQSIRGFWFKARGEFTKALKCYETAERLLPEDAALKLLTARLLIETFNQPDTVVRKIEKMLAAVPRDATVLHQAWVLIGMCQIKKGDQAKARDALNRVIKTIPLLDSASLVDFGILEKLQKKEAFQAQARDMLDAIEALAQKRSETTFVELVGRLRGLFSS